MSRQQRRYTPEEIAAALAILEANGGNVSRTARDMGVPRKTLASWAESNGPAMPDGETRQQEKETLADVFERVAYRAAGLQDVAMAWIEERGGEVAAKHLSDLNRVGGTAVDKTQLLRGQAHRDAGRRERRR